MRKPTLFLLFCLPLFLIAQNYHQYVNPLIGTGGHGHTFPGATLPYGMVQLSPDTRIDGSWDGCSGYHYSDKIIYGFSHTHLNGTGVSDYGDIMLMPTMGVTSIQSEHYSSNFNHSKEKATAGYYSVHLNKYNIDVELTTSTRVGLHKYRFNEDGLANIILDLKHRDVLLNGEIRVVNNTTLEVYRKSEAWATNQQIWARIEFSQPMNFGQIEEKQNPNALDYVNRIVDTGMIISKKVKKGDEIMVKVSLSFTGFQGAKLNSIEIKNWDFNQVKLDAEKAWNKELSKIEVKSADTNKLSIFYTALYHTMMQPNIAQDIDGKYMGRDFKVHKAKGFTYYTVFSLWDTFRAAHPLYTLIDKRRTVDYINTFITQYEQGGRLPVWELASNETDCMIGYHSVSVMADAMVKGIRGFDYEKAFEAAKHSAMLNIYGLEAYKKNGFISIDDEHESVSKTLEYAYDDWCIAQMALILGKDDDYQYFMKRSQNWKNLLDPQTKLMRPKKNAGWLTPFDGREVNNHFTEANSWQYSFFVPQDIPGLIQFHGGKEKLELKLDELFKLPSQTTGRQQVDITGLIGQYAHGNEPSHHVAYLYNYVGKPQKTKQKVHYILDKFYTTEPDGLIGNEDCGQMSAWYILSAMGIYAVTPGKLGWDVTEPYFDEIKINFEDGTSQTITKKTPEDVLKNLGFGRAIPLIQKPFEELIPVPYFEFDRISFGTKMQVKLRSLKKGEEIFYALEKLEDDEESNSKLDFVTYVEPITIQESTKVHAYVKRGDLQSATIFSSFFKKPNDFSITVQSKVHPLYTAGSPEALLDGILGTINWKKGDWQGYQGTDFEAIIDMKKLTNVEQVSANFLQDVRPWILAPKAFRVSGSVDGKNYEVLGEEKSKTTVEDEKVQIEKLTVHFAEKKLRYLKIRAVNYGKLPPTHISAGENAYIFIDEIQVK